MREIGIDSFYIELYENFNCENIEQLLKKEGQLIREIGNLNKKNSGRTDKESKQNYYNKNKEAILERRKEYRNKKKLQKEQQQQPTGPEQELII